MELLDAVDPSLLDWYMTRKGRAFTQQRTDQPDDGQDNLFAPMPADSYAPTGEWGEKAKARSLYTRYLQRHPKLERVIAGGALLGVLALVRRLGRS